MANHEMETPEEVFAQTSNRRKWLKAAGMLTGASIAAGAGWYGWRSYRGRDDEVVAAGRSELDSVEAVTATFPARRDKRFAYGRDETAQVEAARYTNFYEFSNYKWCWRYVEKFKPYPWKIRVAGACERAFELDLDELLSRYAKQIVERQYRHRCVERWAMAVPWTGIPLAALLKDASPLPSATHVRFVSFQRPKEAPRQKRDDYPWPYVEGLTLPEAMNDLTLMATGVYGQPLLKQHGAPLRAVVPWKYGYKSPKSIELIELVEREPATFWTTLNPTAYPFQSNVNPAVSRPWPQDEEKMLGTGERLKTQYLNGYEKYLGGLYV